MSLLWRVPLVLVSVVALAGVLGSAVRTVVLPRGVPARLSRAVFVVLEGTLRLAVRSRRYRVRDAVYAGLAPFYLLALLAVWLIVVLLAFSGLIEAIQPQPYEDALLISGTDLVSLGDVDVVKSLLGIGIVETAVGLALLGLLIGYLPVIYGAFSSRESAVAELSLRAVDPIHGPALMLRTWRSDRMRSLPRLFQRWTGAFIDLAESHVSFPALVWFRSPQSDLSWITAAGAVLDAAALTTAAVEPNGERVEATIALVTEAELCLAAGTRALDQIGAFQGVLTPDPEAELLLPRAAFDEALLELADAGLPIRDADAAWSYFVPRRRAYEAVLVALAAELIAPSSPWSSDLASGARHRPPLLRLGGGAVRQGVPPTYELPPDLAAALDKG